jgi:hypothetical protein
MKREPGRVRFGAHTKIQRTIFLTPELDDWVRRDAGQRRCSVSAMINHLLGQQLDLRRQLAAVDEASTNGNTPLLQVLLEQHRETLGRSLDGLAGEVHKVRGALDFLKAMVDRSTHELLAAAAPTGEVAQRYDRWIAGVKRLLQGHTNDAKPKGETP